MRKHTTQGVVVIGLGADTNSLPCNSHEVLIAAGADPKGNVASIRIRPTGEVLVNEKVVGNDPEVFEGLKQVIYAILRIDCAFYTCNCGYGSHYPYPKQEELLMDCPLCGKTLIPQRSK